MSSMQPICRLEFKDFVSVCLVCNTFLNIIMAFSMFSQILVMLVRNHLRVESIIWLDALSRTCSQPVWRYVFFHQILILEGAAATDKTFVHA